MDNLVFAVVLLLCILLFSGVLYAWRYWPTKKEKQVYRVAFQMPEASQEVTTETRPQLLSLSDAEVDLVFQIEDDED